MLAPYVGTSHVTALLGDCCAKQLSVLGLPFGEESDVIGHILLTTS